MENTRRIKGSKRRINQSINQSRRSRGRRAQSTTPTRRRASARVIKHTGPETKIDVKDSNLSETQLVNGEPEGRHKALSLLTIAMVVSLAPWFSATAALQELKQILKIESDTLASLLTIAVQLGFAIGATLSSVLTLPDRFGARRVGAFGALMASLTNACLLFAFVGEMPYAVAVLIRATTGGSLALVYPPLMKVAATWFTKHSRGTALGILVGGLTVGSALPHLANVGPSNALIVITSASVLSAFGSFLVEFVCKDGPLPFPRAAAFKLGDAVRVAKNRGVVLATAAYNGHMLELYTVWTWFALIAKEAVGADYASLVTFFFIAIGAVGAYGGGKFGDRFSRTRTTAFIMGVSGLCCIFVGLSLYEAPVPVTLIISGIWGIFVIADSAQFSAVIVDLADQQFVGTALTLQIATGFLISSLTIFLLPVLVEQLTLRWAFAVISVGPLLGLFAMLALSVLPEKEHINGGRG